MNYYDALRRSDDGRWDYVSTNRRTGTHPVGYCAKRIGCVCWIESMAAQPDCAEGGGSGLIDNPDHCGGHETADEARECFARYLLDGWREESYGDWTGCVWRPGLIDEDGTDVRCDHPTKQGLTTRPPLGHGYPLCDEHRTFEVLRQLAPTSAGQICASY